MPLRVTEKARLPLPTTQRGIQMARNEKSSDVFARSNNRRKGREQKGYAQNFVFFFFLLLLLLFLSRGRGCHSPTFRLAALSLACSLPRVIAVLLAVVPSSASLPSSARFSGALPSISPPPPTYAANEASGVRSSPLAPPPRPSLVHALHLRQFQIEQRRQLDSAHRLLLSLVKRFDFGT